MLYIIYGTDTNKVRAKLTSLTDVLQAKRPDAPVVRIKPENWNDSFLNETLSSNALFAPKSIIILDALISNAASADAIISSLDEIAASEHICIIVDEKIKAAELKKLEKKAEKVQEFNIEKDDSGKKQAPQTFAFADAIASKDKKLAWRTFQRLVNEGVAAEEIHGVLWWQFKSMALAAQYKNAKDAGLNPYVHSKCAVFNKKWEEGLDTKLESLVKMYHEAHRGEIDFMSEIESLCL